MVRLNYRVLTTSCCENAIYMRWQLTATAPQAPACICRLGRIQWGLGEVAGLRTIKVFGAPPGALFQDIFMGFPATCL